MIRVQHEDFDAGTEINRMRLARPDTGAVAAFVGQVRDLNEGDAVSGMTLEHYPGMTERAIEKIVAEACARWPLDDVTVIHRYGRLEPGEPIVFVGVSSAHRQAAFDACNFVMDYLKTRAPFWKLARRR